jgi:hypothetical protein
MQPQKDNIFSQSKDVFSIGTGLVSTTTQSVFYLTVPVIIEPGSKLVKILPDFFLKVSSHGTGA